MLKMPTMESSAKTFHHFCHELGILPPLEMPLGKWVDCPTVSHPRKKKGRVKLSDDGNTGFAMDWVSMTEFAIWNANGVFKDTKSLLDNAELNERIALRKKEEWQGILRARAHYSKSTPIKGANHPYCHKKKIVQLGLNSLRIDTDGWLVVPVSRDDRIISVQRISPDGEKRFATGAPMKFGTFTLHRPGALLTILCEGLATAATCLEAVPQSRVIACFSAANMIEVAKRSDWSGMVAVAGDNDSDTYQRIGKNPGKEAGEEAAKAIGCGVAYPEYSEVSDWNDVFAEQLARLETENADLPFPKYPQQLRRAALAPIQSLIMRAMKKVG